MLALHLNRISGRLGEVQRTTLEFGDNPMVVALVGSSFRLCGLIAKPLSEGDCLLIAKTFASSPCSVACCAIERRVGRSRVPYGMFNEATLGRMLSTL